MSNQYTYSVPFTAHDLYKCYEDQEMTQQEIADKFNTTQKVVWGAMKKAGINARPAIKRDQRREKNSSWKGGRVLVAKSKTTRFSNGGYWYILNPEHPNAGKNGYVAEHIMVASEKIGRPLKKGECVHHLDMNKQNNDPANLSVCNRSQHRNYHLQLELIAVEMFRNGNLIFRNGRYQYA